MASISQEASFKEALDLLNYTDFSYRGFVPGSTFILKKELAVKNALKMYLFSQRGDYGRNVTKGGPLIDFIGKPIDSQTQDDLRKRIIAELDTFPNIIVNEVNVKGDREAKSWVIQVIFTDLYNKFTDELNYEMG